MPRSLVSPLEQGRYFGLLLTFRYCLRRLAILSLHTLLRAIRQKELDSLWLGASVYRLFRI